MKRSFFTSESVTEGHPDKLCDQISDAILDALLAADSESKVACETIVTTGMVFVMGEITSMAKVDYTKIVRDVIRSVGYTSSIYGFDADTCAVITNFDKQSPDIAQGVNRSNDTQSVGAGDQGMVFGYACDETKDYIPLPISLAHQLAQRLTYVRKSNVVNGLRPDGKTQVTMEYCDGKPQRVDTIIISTQHDEDVDLDTLKKEILEKVVLPVIPFDYRRNRFNLLVNPTGKFVIGGPHGDSGLTGRKIIVDTYGGFARHGGGAFSGKDPTKVDRSAAYMARYIAKNIVAAEVAQKCEVQISYAIGLSEPISLLVDTFGTSVYPEHVIENLIRKVFDLTPSAIISTLDLKQPIYQDTACYGHFGRRDVNFSWEKTDKIEDIHKALFEMLGTGIYRI